MTKFYKDLETVYDLLNIRDKQLHKFYTPKEQEDRVFLENFSKELNIPINDESLLAVATRVVALKEEGLIQILKKEGKTEEEIEQASLKAYEIVSSLYLQRHEEFLDIIDTKELLTPFYRILLRGVHNAGIGFTKWQPKWTAKIIYDQNKVLKKLKGDDVISFLKEKNLLDLGENGKIGDRSYSILHKESMENSLKSISYYEGFTNEVTEITDSLEKLTGDLESEEDQVFNQKEQWISYFTSIKEALLEIDTSKLIKRWADVDRAWMEVTTPIQVGHPLEYYEDHYRKAVAPEWDVRIVNPKLQSTNTTGESVKGIFSYLFRAVSTPETKHVKKKVEKDINRTKLFIGRPALFYGAEFNGLFSAQVVPNDENVTKEYGKKIFAFSDFVLEGQRAKPFSLLDREIFGETFLKEERGVLFKNPDIWHRLYDIETIGHEYGHILWMDGDTEQQMNESGNFKNLEEFKATAGGLVAFFENREDPKLVRDLFISVIKRAVKLMAWRETPEVEPYYVEGIIHLTGMFQTGVLVYENEQLTIDLDPGKLDGLRVWYVATYRAMAIHYMKKEDSAYFLEQFVIKDEEDTFLPYYFEIRDFVNHFWKRYKEIGQVVDDKESKNEWV